jgi:hypothetical protein
MKILCLDVPQPGATMEIYQPHMLAEARHGWSLYKKGFVRDISFRKDRPGVAIVAEADSVEAAKAELMQFPLAKVGLIDWEMIPLGAFANWEMLFTPNEAK